MKRSLLLIGLLCSLPLMAQQRWFTMQVRQPAEMLTPVRDTALHSLLLVNNCVPQADSFGHLNKLDDASSSSSVNLREAPRQFLFGLEAGLDEQASLADHSVLDASQNHSGSFYNRRTLSDAQADSLCQLYGTEAVLVLNQLILYDIEETYLTDQETWYAYLQTYSTAHLSFHRLGQRGAFSFVSADTLVWEAEEATKNAALAALPDRQTALLDFAYDDGQQLARRLFPQWVNTDRYLYVGKDARFEQAMRLFSSQQWAAAAALWTTIASDPAAHHLDIAYALADVAVCQEMQEDYKGAIQQVDAALRAFRKVHTAEAAQQIVNLQYYRSQLEQRSRFSFS